MHKRPFRIFTFANLSARNSERAEYPRKPSWKRCRSAAPAVPGGAKEVFLSSGGRPQVTRGSRFPPPPPPPTTRRCLLDGHRVAFENCKAKSVRRRELLSQASLPAGALPANGGIDELAPTSPAAGLPIPSARCPAQLGVQVARRSSGVGRNDSTSMGDFMDTLQSALRVARAWR